MPQRHLLIEIAFIRWLFPRIDCLR